MTSKLNIPTISKVNNVVAESGIKSLVGRKMTRNVKFCNEDIKINKLTVAQVLEIQEKAKSVDKDDSEGFNVLKTVIRSSVDGGSDLTDEDFSGFPLDELSKLSTEIMKFSGIGQEAGK